VESIFEDSVEVQATTTDIGNERQIVRAMVALMAQVEGAFQNLDHLMLQLHLFNTHMSEIVFWSKLGCLTGAIMGGFAFIRLIETDALFATMYASVAINCFGCFIFMYNKADELTEGVEELKRRVQLKAIGFCVGEEREIIRVKVRAIPRMGIQCGGFSVIERESTPIFLDFSFKQIMSLLLAF
jgi:hypothetical protein